MPNWAYNTLKISGKPIELTAFKYKATLESKDQNGNTFKEDLAIENFIQMPKELEGTQSPSTPLTPGEYIKALKEYNERIKNNPDTPFGKPLTQKMSMDLKQKYGADNWYDWNIANLGTKWGFKSSELIKEGKGYIKYQFDTAWSPPSQAILTLSKLCPGMTFELRFSEESREFKGMEKFRNGEMIDSAEYNP